MAGIHNFSDTVSTLFQSMDKLSEALRSDFAYDLCNNLVHDQEENSRLKEAILKSLPLLTIRLLSYDEPKGESGEEIAKLHIDKCGLTNHLYSSHPGLQIEVGKDGSKRIWEDFDIPFGECALFGGYQLHKWSEGRIKPLGHRVVSRTPGKREAVVVFVPLFDALRFPKDKRMQDMMDEQGY